MDTYDSVCRAKPLLGTFVEITSAGTVRTKAELAIEAAFEAVAEVHRLMSFHERDSDLSRLNREAYERNVAVNSWTWEVLDFALDLHKRSAGTFDISVAARLQQLGLLPRDTDGVQSTGMTNRSDAIELLPDYQVRFHHPSLRIDLGGIAKGFAVDRAIAVLRAHDQSHGLVNAGGDLAVFGSCPKPIHLRDPRDPRRLLCQVKISNAALASTARAFNPLVSADTLALAVIDPMAQEPAHDIAGVTVRAPSCMIADALTKVVMITGEGAAALLRQYQASALLVYPSGDVRMTPEWQDGICAAA